MAGRDETSEHRGEPRTGGRRRRWWLRWGWSWNGTRALVRASGVVGWEGNSDLIEDACGNGAPESAGAGASRGKLHGRAGESRTSASTPAWITRRVGSWRAGGSRLGLGECTIPVSLATRHVNWCLSVHLTASSHHKVCSGLWICLWDMHGTQFEAGHWQTELVHLRLQTGTTPMHFSWSRYKEIQPTLL